MGQSLSWGKPKICVGVVGANGAAPTAWKEEYTPVEGSAKLIPTKGKESKATVEGGGLEGHRQAANEYTFEYEVRRILGRTLIVPHKDGIIADEYAVQLIPENAATEGFIIDRSSVVVEDTWDAENGAKLKYTYNALVPSTGDVVKWGVQTSKV